MKKKSYFVYGIHAVQALLENQPERVIELWVLQGRQDKKLDAIQKTASQFGLSIQSAHRKALDEKSKGEQHQGVIAKVKEEKALSEHDLADILEQQSAPFLLILDGVTDPHNLGACLRSADAAGVHAVIVPKDNSVGLTPVVSKVASGAAEVIPLIQVTNLARTMASLKERGVWLIGAAGEATSTLYQTNLKGSLALVMGAEGKGLRRLTREHCDSLVSLPMAGQVSSLNVSVAAGICLFEAVRQRSES